MLGNEFFEVRAIDLPLNHLIFDKEAHGISDFLLEGLVAVLVIELLKITHVLPKSNCTHNFVDQVDQALNLSPL